MDINKQIIITSVNRALNKAKGTGQLNLSIIALFNMYSYYVDYTNSLKELGISVFNRQNRNMKEVLNKMKYKYPESICNYKLINSNISISDTLINTAPTVSPQSINIESNQEYIFKVSDFTKDFFDKEGDSYSTVIIYPSGLNGELYYNDVMVTNRLEISVNNVVSLKYVRVDDSVFINDTFNFKISDTNLQKKYSILTAISMNGDAIGDNQPATIGDNTIYVANRTTTILSLAVFTSQLTPPYNDPEGDLIDAIRIDEISTANLGFFQLNDINVVVGQIITREDLNAGLFTHVGPDQDAINSDVINFSARDEGSLKWVQ